MSLLVLHSSLNIPKMLSRSLSPVILATAGVLIGFPPGAEPFVSSFGYAAYAQEYSEQQVQQYARAVLNIEPHRQQAFEDIKQVIGRQPPNIVCNQPSSYGSLPDDAQTIAQKYCRISKEIVESLGLSVSLFNEITIEAQSSNNLESRIQDAMIEIQGQ